MTPRYFRDDLPRPTIWKVTDIDSFVRLCGDTQWMDSICTVDDLEADPEVIEISAEQGEI